MICRGYSTIRLHIETVGCNVQLLKLTWKFSLNSIKVRIQGSFTYRRFVEVEVNEVDKTINNFPRCSKPTSNFKIFWRDRCSLPIILILVQNYCGAWLDSSLLDPSLNPGDSLFTWVLRFKILLENPSRWEYFLVGRLG